jgi:hypothetical protein
VGRILLTLAVTVAVVALAITVAMVFAGGSGAFTEFDVSTLQYVWPTLVALAILMAVGLRSTPLAPPRGLIPTAMGGWIASTVAYVLQNGSYWSLGRFTGSAIVAGVPILVVSGVLTTTNRHEWATIPRVIVGICVALALAWLAVPMFLTVVCLLTGDCL